MIINFHFFGTPKTGSVSLTLKQSLFLSSPFISQHKPQPHTLPISRNTFKAFLLHPGPGLDDLDRIRIQCVQMAAALKGTIASEDFQDRFNTLLVKAETLEDRLMELVNSTDPELKKSLAGLNDVTIKVGNLVEGVKPPIDNLFANTDAVIGNANNLIAELEGVTKHLDELIAKVQSKENTVGALLSDRTLHDDLVKTVHSADSLFRVILHDGLDVNVDIF